MKAKRVKRIAGKVGRTGLDVAKLYLAAESGNVMGGNKAALDLAKVWGGENNLLQRAEDKVDKKLSKYSAYRVGKSGFKLYNDVRGGNYTGAYKDSVDVAKKVMGKKMYSKSGLQGVDRSIEKYVLPTAQYTQDAYKLYKNINTLPKNYSKARSTGAVKDVLRVGLKANSVRSGINKVARPLYK